MELCSGGDLMFHVQKEGKFSENKAKLVFFVVEKFFGNLKFCFFEKILCIRNDLCIMVST